MIPAAVENAISEAIETGRLTDTFKAIVQHVPTFVR